MKGLYYLAIMLVKTIKALLPESLFNFLKNNPGYLALYKKMTRSVGLSGSLLPWKKQKSTYIQHLKFQTEALNQYISSVDCFSEITAGTNHKNTTAIAVIFCPDKFGSSQASRLNQTIDSVRSQSTDVKKLVIIDGYSRSHKNTTSIQTSLQDYCTIKQKECGLEINAEQSLASLVSLSESSSEALGYDEGKTHSFHEYLLLNLGDVLSHPHSLAVLTDKLLEEQADAVYCDTDAISHSKQRMWPRYLPDWDPDLLLTTGYIRTGVLLTEQVLRNVLTTPGLELEKYATASTSISQLIAELYCSSLDSSSDSYSQVKQANLAVVKVNWVLVSEPEKSYKRFAKDGQQLPKLTRFKNEGLVTSSHIKNTVQHIQWKVGDPTQKASPLVSLIIPTKNQKGLVKLCIDSIVNKTTYTNYEIILVDNNSDCPESIEYFEQLAQQGTVNLVKYPHPFNYSAINNFAVTKAKGDVIGLINNDVEVIEAQWLEYMVGHVVREDIGCVGAKLLYPNQTIQHAGVVMGYGGGAGHAHKYFDESDPGYLNRISATNSFSAVTAACLLVTRKDFDAVKGLNEKDLTVAFNDVDFCMKVASLNKRNLYCAEAVLFHHESISRGDDVSPEKRKRFESELSYLQKEWGTTIEDDPCYNPWLTLKHENFSLKESLK